MATPTCEAPRLTVSKNSKSPGFTSRGSIVCPAPYCSRTSRGRRMPFCANTHCTNPLQSNPDGSLPPLRYGIPLSIIAVETMAVGATGDAGTTTGGPTGAGGRAEGGSGAPGNGRGRGVPPVVAQAAAQRAIRTTTTSLSLPGVESKGSCNAKYCNRLTPFVTWFLGTRILD